MTKHTDTSRSTDPDSSAAMRTDYSDQELAAAKAQEEAVKLASAPNSPELTGLSGEQAEERTAREGRAREWFHSKEVTQLRWDWCDRYKYSAEDAEVKLLAAFAQTECSRLASRVELLEKALDDACWDIANENEFNPIDSQPIIKNEYLRLAGAHAEEKG